MIARGVKKEERKPIILDVAKKVGIEKRLKNKVTKLSGGEKQRTAIARALVSDAPILVCDEITGNLDHDTSIEIIKLLHSLSQDKLVLMVTHDPEEVMQYATRVISMYDGTIQSDKVLKEVNYTEEVKIKDTKPISRGEIFKLALKSLKNTPKKTILLVLVLLLATIFIGFACASVNANNDLTSGYNYYYSNTSYDKKRILVKRQDNAILTDTDYNYFKGISDVNYVYRNNFVIDEKMQIRYVNYDNDIYFNLECFIYNSEMLQATRVTLGRLPENKGEMVIETPETNYDDLKKLIGEEFSCGTSKASFKAKLVGIIVTKDLQEAKIFVDKAIFNKYQEISLVLKCARFSTWLSADAVFVSDMIGEKTLNLYYSWETKGLEDTTSLYYTVNGESKTIDNIKLNHKIVSGFNEIVSETGIDILDYFNNMDEYFSNYAVMSKDLYDTVVSLDTNETSIYVDDAKHAASVQKTLNDNGYIAVIAYYEQTNETANILGAILSVFLYLFCIALAGVIYLLSYLSLKNIIYSERKDLLIMRSLGIGVKQVVTQIYIKLVGISIVTTACFIAVSIVLHGLYFPTYHILHSIARMRPLEMVYMVVLMLGMTYLLSRKFAKNIFKANIASKDKEELQWDS